MKDQTVPLPSILVSATCGSEDPAPEQASLELDVVVTGAGWAVVAVLVRLSDHGRILNYTLETGCFPVSVILPFTWGIL